MFASPIRDASGWPVSLEYVVKPSEYTLASSQPLSTFFELVEEVLSSLKLVVDVLPTQRVCS